MLNFPVDKSVACAQDGISTIITAIVNSRKIFRRLETYIIYRVASSLLILVFFFFAIICLELEMPTWVLVLISITNDLSVMATALDRVSIWLPFCFTEIEKLESVFV